MPPPDGIDVQLVSPDEAGRHLDELTAVCREVYAEPPHEWDAEHEELFIERFKRQCQSAGFSLVEARCGDEVIGFGFGLTLPPATPWWSRLVTPLPDDVTQEYEGRTFALIELLVRKPWRRQHVAETIHDQLMQGRHEERATLTALPAADAAQAAYAKWGWYKVAQKRNPLPGSPIFNVLVKELRTSA
ncbi:MAG: GNAT family N-acetyltransferase [Pseudonocardiaceae bacterium]